MKYISALTLFYLILGLILMIFSLKFSKDVLFLKNFWRNTSRISPMLNIYFIFLLIHSTVSLLYNAYLIAFWRPEENIYDAILMYWLGFFQLFLGFLGSILDIFLCLDRCFSIIIPMGYRGSHRICLSIASIITLFISSAIILWISPIYNAIPTTSKTACQFFGCLLKVLPVEHVPETKIVLAIINLIGGSSLYFLVHHSLKGFQSQNKNITKSILIIVASTTILELIPNLLADIYFRITNVTINTVIGPYAVTVTAVNITICAAMYSKACRKAFGTHPQMFAPRISSTVQK